MVGEDRVTMSMKELRRVHVIRHVLEKTMTQVKAGALLGLTVRQIRRITARVRHEGEVGVVHRGRGQPSNRRMAEPLKAKILRLYAQRYGDFGPTLAAEKLAERHGLAVSAETLRGWLLATGVTHFRRRKRPHRAWRARKPHVGELVPLDGSRVSEKVLEPVVRVLTRTEGKLILFHAVPPVDAANQFLEAYLPQYNRRFAVPPAQAADLHRPRPAAPALDRVLCLKTQRVLRRDWTVAHNGHLYQVQTPVRTPRVMVEERLDGTLRITHHGRLLTYEAITARPVRVPAPSTVSMPQRPGKPTPDHPWRKRLLPERDPHAAAART